MDFARATQLALGVLQRFLLSGRQAFDWQLALNVGCDLRIFLGGCA
jgi:hypothetical protein